MTITQIIQQGKGKAHAWRVTCDTGLVWSEFTLWHYSTPMASWRVHRNTGEQHIFRMGIGHGSVSDQNGMNILFRTLNAPFYFSRKGGARIRDLETNREFTVYPYAIPQGWEPGEVLSH